MKKRQILVSLMVLIILGAYYYFVEVKKKSADEKMKAAEGLLLPGFAGVKAVGLEIKGTNGNISLKKYKEQWNIDSPIQAQADNVVCDSAIARLASEKYGRKLDNIKADDFGLNPPMVKVTITGADNKQYGILFGPANPSGDNVYASLPGETGTAYTVEAPLKNEFDRKVFYWRDKKILNFQGMDIDRIQSAIKDKKFTIIRTNGVWAMTSHENNTVSADKIMSMIDRIKNTFAISMIEPKAADLKKYGLAYPGEFISFYAGNQEAKLYFGREDEKNNSRFVKGTFHKDIMEIPDKVYKDINTSEDLIDSRVVIFDQAKALKLKVKYAGREILAIRKVKDKGIWELAEVKGFKDDEKKRISPSSIVYYTSMLEYKDKIALKNTVDEDIRFGFENGVIIGIYGADGAEIVSINIGKQVQGREEFYLKIPAQGAVYTVEKNFIQGLNLPGLEVK